MLRPGIQKISLSGRAEENWISIDFVQAVHRYRQEFAQLRSQLLQTERHKVSQARLVG
jgi:hypothetical protein